MTEQSKLSRENKQSIREVMSLSSTIENLWDKEQQQQVSKSSKRDAQLRCAYKVVGYSFGKSLIDNL